LHRRASATTFVRVLVLYVSFVVDGDRNAVDDWFGPLAATTRAVDECVLYELLHDPYDPQRGVILEAWSSPAAREAYLLMPHHVEMVAEATRRYGMRDFRTLLWRDAGEVTIGGRHRSEQADGDRHEMNRLVAERLTHAEGDP
jgi:quinol monooxygenase YgiN